MSTPIPPTDLTQRPPRSPRAHLGGYVILPRILDKCRAVLAGTNGDYKYACPLDQNFFEFTGINPEAFKAQVALGKGDGEMLAWVEANAPLKRSPWEIHHWSAFMQQRGPSSDPDTLGFFGGAVAGISKTREDIRAWADLLDLDDYASYGGKV